MTKFKPADRHCSHTLVPVSTLGGLRWAKPARVVLDVCWWRWSHAFQLCSRLWGQPARVMFRMHVSAPLKKRKRETILVKYNAKVTKQNLSARFGGCPQHIYKSPHPFFCVSFSCLNRANLAVSALIAATQKGLMAQKAKSVQRPISCTQQLHYWEESMQIHDLWCSFSLFIDRCSWCCLVLSGLFIHSSGLKCQTDKTNQIYVHSRTVPRSDEAAPSHPFCISQASTSPIKGSKWAKPPVRRPFCMLSEPRVSLSNSNWHIDLIGPS